MPGIAKVTADITVELDGSVMRMSVEGNASKLKGMQELGSYVGMKVDEQVRKMLGFDASKALADTLQKKLAASEAKLAALRKQLEREALAAELGKEPADAKR